MAKKEIEKIELERDFYNIMSNYGKLDYKITKTIDELNEMSKLSFLVMKEIKAREDKIKKAIEYIENNSLYKEEVDYDYEENPIYIGCNDIKAREELLDILKGE